MVLLTPKMSSHLNWVFEMGPENLTLEASIQIWVTVLYESLYLGINPALLNTMRLPSESKYRITLLAEIFISMLAPHMTNMNSNFSKPQRSNYSCKH